MSASNSGSGDGSLHVLGPRDLLEPMRTCPVQEANRRALLLARLRAALGQPRAGLSTDESAERLGRDFGLGFGTGAVVVGLMWGVVAWFG